MPRDPRQLTPRNFFLNEQHELAHGEKEGGGSLPKLVPIDWRAKGQNIHDSLSAAREDVRRSSDPLRDKRYFLATTPTARIKKHSANSRRAPTGVLEETTDYAGEHSRIFRRLGLDLLAVDKAGRALIHMPASRIEQLLTTSSGLETEGRREQARWITIDSFEAAPASFRIDKEWVEGIPALVPLDVVVELQPLLSRLEVEQVMHAIIGTLAGRSVRERFNRTGTDFSGRQWYRGVLSRESLMLIANQFFSVQALHPPLQTEIAVASGRKPSNPASSPNSTSPAVDVTLMPVVAVVDVGVPAGHSQLSPFRRGAYISPDVPTDIRTDHGSHVASRIVFGDPDFSAGVEPVRPTCSFLDVNIAVDAHHIDDKAILGALQAVVGTYPDVRVFNLSFGEYSPLNAHLPIERREKLLLLQDLDNFIFRSDVVVVVAAGNSRPGLVPTPNYPNHVNNPQWALGSWACGFNTLKCGSYVGRLTSGGLVNNIGWPSPFTRVGPGLCNAPMPEFSANGGNCTEQFAFGPGLGVYALSAGGIWEDFIGTSLAAPLLSREAAFLLADLQRRCEQGARPFAATIKAFLALTAAPAPADLPSNVKTLSERTLGRGTGSSSQLRAPNPESAVMVWQGVLVGPEDKARVQVPIPRAWLQEASRPRLRIIGAWESPVNVAVEHVWASRKIEFQLRPTPSSKALSPGGKNHPSYPILERKYELGADTLEKKGIAPPDSDFWVLEISYREIAEYTATIDFSPHQRVGIAMELVDEGDLPASPQHAMQALPQAITMTRLTVPENRIANPIVVRPRV